MNKNFEDEYRKYTVQQAPDLWARIEAGLPEEKTGKAMVNPSEIADATVKTDDENSAGQEKKQPVLLKDMECIVSPLKEDSVERLSLNTAETPRRNRILAYSGMAAAVLVVLLSVPFLIGIRRNSSFDMQTACDEGSYYKAEEAACEMENSDPSDFGSDGLVNQDTSEKSEASERYEEYTCEAKASEESEAKSDTNGLTVSDTPATNDMSEDEHRTETKTQTSATEVAGSTTSDYSLRVDNVTIEIIRIEKREDCLVATAKVIMDATEMFTADSEILITLGEFDVQEGMQYTVTLIDQEPWMSLEKIYGIEME